MIPNAPALSGTPSEPAVSVTVNVPRAVAGAVVGEIAGTAGPTAVARACPRGRVTTTLSPWIASAGWAALAWMTRTEPSPRAADERTTTVVRGRAPPRLLGTPSGRLKTSVPNGASPGWAA